MTSDQALAELLPERTDDHVADLLNGAREIQRRRVSAPELAYPIVHSLLYHYTYRDIEELTGIPKSTAQGWASSAGDE